MRGCATVELSLLHRNSPRAAPRESRDTMPTKIKKRTFNEVLSELGNEKFDVSPATEGANRAAGAYRVSKYGCAAEIAPDGDEAPVRLLAKSGWVLGGEIARLVDRGYQKFFKSTRLEVAVTA